MEIRNEEMEKLCLEAPVLLRGLNRNGAGGIEGLETNTIK